MRDALSEIWTVRFLFERNRTLFTINRTPQYQMQIPKDNIQRLILEVARKEFLRQGVRGASMRAIAKQAGISTGNIYHYFKSKDALFCEVLRPLLHAINQYVVSHNDARHVSLDVFTLDEFHRESIEEMIGLVKRYRPELQLLLFQAESTSLAGYGNRLIERQTEIGFEYLRLMKERYPHLNVDISPFMLHIESATWMMVFAEMIKHTNFNEQELREGLEQWMKFSYAGWKTLMKA